MLKAQFAFWLALENTDAFWQSLKYPDRKKNKSQRWDLSCVPVKQATRWMCKFEQFKICGHINAISSPLKDILEALRKENFHFLWMSFLFLLCVCSVAQSCLTLCNPLDCGLPGSSVHGIFQARMETLSLLTRSHLAKLKESAVGWSPQWLVQQRGRADQPTLETGLSLDLTVGLKDTFLTAVSVWAVFPFAWSQNHSDIGLWF